MRQQQLRSELHRQLQLSAVLQLHCELVQRQRNVDHRWLHWYEHGLDLFDQTRRRVSQPLVRLGCQLLACPTGSTTLGKTSSSTCTCSTGGNSTVAGGYYSNGAAGASLACICTSDPTGPFGPRGAASSGDFAGFYCSCTHIFVGGDRMDGCAACPSFSYQPDLGSNTCVCIAGGSGGSIVAAGVDGGYYAVSSGASLTCNGQD